MLDRKIDVFPRFISHRWHHPAGRPVRVFSVGVSSTATNTATPGVDNHHNSTFSNRLGGREPASHIFTHYLPRSTSRVFPQIRRRPMNEPASHSPTRHKPHFGTETRPPRLLPRLKLTRPHLEAGPQPTVSTISIRVYHSAGHGRSRRRTANVFVPFLPFFSTSRDLCMHLIRHQSRRPITPCPPLPGCLVNFFPILQQEGLVCMRVRTV